MTHDSFFLYILLEADAIQCYLCGTNPGLQNCTSDFKGIETSCDFQPQGASCIKQWKGLFDFYASFFL